MKKEEKKNVVEKEQETDIQKFLRMKKELETLKKSIPKEELKKLSKERERVLSEEMKKLCEDLKPVLKKFEKELAQEFKNSITTEKPEGSKSVSLNVNETYSIAVIRKTKKNSDKEK